MKDPVLRRVDSPTDYCLILLTCFIGGWFMQSLYEWAAIFVERVLKAALWLNWFLLPTLVSSYVDPNAGLGLCVFEHPARGSTFTLVVLENWCVYFAGFVSDICLSLSSYSSIFCSNSYLLLWIFFSLSFISCRLLLVSMACWLVGVWTRFLFVFGGTFAVLMTTCDGVA